MPRMISPRAIGQLLREGDLRARIRATRDGQAAIRLQLVAAALDAGLLDALARGPATGDELAAGTGVADRRLFEAFLRAVTAAGLIHQDGDGGPWRLARSGRAVVEDDLVRASYEAFAGFHTGLYRDLGAQLAGGPPRLDVVEKGEVIARISAAFEPFIQSLLVATVRERRPRRVLDIGCGAGLELATMLRAAPEAVGIGIDADGDAAALAGRTLARQGLAQRATVLNADVREVAASGAGPLAEPVDLALLANIVYYVPPGGRVALLRAVAGLLAPGGVLLVVTTVATPQLVSRHFDLLLRAQDGEMELPGADELVGQLTEAGLQPEAPVTIAPGSPLVAVRATLPAR